jgi:hypothetical protein
MARKKKTEKIVEPEVEIIPRFKGELADRVKAHCNGLFVTPVEKPVEKPVILGRVSFGRGIPTDLAPRGDGAKDAFERDLNMMLTEVDYPENALDDYDLTSI